MALIKRSVTGCLRLVLYKMGQTRVYLYVYVYTQRWQGGTENRIICKPAMLIRGGITEDLWRGMSVAFWSALHTLEALQNAVGGESKRGQERSFEVLLRLERLRKGEKEEGKVTRLRSERKTGKMDVCQKLLLLLVCVCDRESESTCSPAWSVEGWWSPRRRK